MTPLQLIQGNRLDLAALHGRLASAHELPAAQRQRLDADLSCNEKTFRQAYTGRQIQQRNYLLDRGGTG